MVDSCTINIEGIGPILLARNKRARRVIISIQPFRDVRVTVPPGVSLQKAIEFARLKKQWIEKHLARIKQMESQRQSLSSSVIIDNDKAKKKLTSRLHYLAEKYGFTFNKVFIRNQRTRWGSCSHQCNISLNQKLVLLPEELIDYVILHELVHTRVHDHSKRFWDELDKYMGNSRAVASRVRSYEGGLL